jgi:hypothetical protein
LFDPRKSGKKFTILSDTDEKFYFRKNSDVNISKQIEIEFLLDIFHKGRIKKRLDKLFTK